MDAFMQAAIDEAKRGLVEGGIPIGSVLVIDGRIVGRGHNRRIQKGSAVLHAEMDCLENAGDAGSRVPAGNPVFDPLSVRMCSGAILLYKIPRVVIGEHQTFQGPEDYLRSRGVNLVVLDDEDCRRLMLDFIASRPEVWYEDIGEG
jgi:cytosine deaminase